MKTKMKTIGLAMACAIAASTASADHLKWFGVEDGNWWTPGNWWDTSAETIVSSDFTNNYEFGSIEFGDGINANTELNWSTTIVSRTTINLGGNNRPITTSRDVTVSYYGRIINSVWYRSYDGGPIIFTDGTLTVDGKVQVANSSNDDNRLPEVPPAVLKLQDVTLTCNSIELYNGGASKSKLILDGNTSVTANWFGCSYTSTEEGCVELNGGTLNIPTFSYVKYVYVDYNATENSAFTTENGGTGKINMTVVFNGGTLKVSPNNNLQDTTEWDSDNKKIEYNGSIPWDFAHSSLIPEWMKVEIGEGGIVIDSNGYDVTFAATNVTQASGVKTDGGLTKKGNGKLTVTKGVVWNGPTKVLGGTLDLNDGTITGPLVLGGNGRIVNATIDTTDITIQSDYVFDTEMWENIGQTNSWAITSIKVSGAAAFASPSNSVLKSATAWYDPSDTSEGNLTTNENGCVTIKNKSATGDSMDAVLAAVETKDANNNVVSRDYYTPTTTTINGHTAIAFSDKPGFVSAGAASFAAPQGKSIFAVAQFTPDGWWQTVYPIEWCGWYDGDKDSNFGMYLQWEQGENSLSKGVSGYYRISSASAGSGVEDTSLSIDIAERTSPYVMSLRGTRDVGENEDNIFARVTSISNDGIVDGNNSASASLSFQYSEYQPHVAYGWARALVGYSNNGAVGEALAFARCLSDEEAEVVQTYLANKWVSSSIPATWPLVIGTLTLDGTADFNGANVTVTTALAGAGSIAATSLKVTGGITATMEATAEKAQIAVTGDVDVSDANFAVDAALAESLDYNESVTLLTSTGTITGFGSPVVLTDGSSKFKVRKSNGAITVTRLQPGLAIVIR